MKLLKNLELVEVAYEDQKAVLTFLDAEQGEIREVNFNKQVYKNGKYEDDEEKAKQVEEWCKEYFNCGFKELSKAIGEKRDIYAYDNFNSLLLVDIVEKFDSDMEGQIFETAIESIEDDGKAIVIKFKYEGKIHQSKMAYAKYLEDRKEWFVDPIKRDKKMEKFEEKFQVPFSEKDSLINKKIMVEVKKAFNKFMYAEIKPFPKKK